MLECLDAIAWDDLTDAYGYASDLPSCIRGLLTADRERFMDELANRTCHQGTRWEVSAHVIAPLCEIVDIAEDEPTRVYALRLFDDLALGETNEDDLPFEPSRVFAEAEDLRAADIRSVYRRMLEDPDFDSDEEGSERIDLAGVVWARDAYLAAAECSPNLLRWAQDPMPKVSMHALVMSPWFSDIRQAMVPIGREIVEGLAPVEVAVTAWVTLGLLGAEAVVDWARPVFQSDSPIPVRVAAAIACAYTAQKACPDEALETLLDAEKWRAELDTGSRGLPLRRPLLGHVARALRRVE